MIRIQNLWQGTTVDLPDDSAAWAWIHDNVPWVLLRHPATLTAALTVLDRSQNYRVDHDAPPAPQKDVSDAARLVRAAELYRAGVRNDPALRAHHVRYEGDDEAVALAGAGLEPTQGNRGVLRSLLLIGQPVAKSMSKTPDVVPGPGAEEAARVIKDAFAENAVQKPKLGGRHSAGSLVVTDAEAGAILFLKPGSGGVSPAKGVSEEPASPSRREAAFYHASVVFGLEHWLPRCDLVTISGKEYAAQNWLGPDYQPLIDLARTQPGRVRVALAPLLADGTIHRIAAMLWVLGETDAHGHNVLGREGMPFQLIDHGSAFAGASFDPGGDPQATFVPWLLRYFANGWNPEDGPAAHYAALPLVCQSTEDALKAWIRAVDKQSLAVVLSRFGITVTPSLNRLEKLAFADGYVAENVNAAWTVGL